MPESVLVKVLKSYLAPSFNVVESKREFLERHGTAEEWQRVNRLSIHDIHGLSKCRADVGDPEEGEEDDEESRKMEEEKGEEPEKVVEGELYVKTLTGRIITLQGALGKTVEGVKELIAVETGIPVPQQTLLYAGKQMAESQTLANHHIYKGATIMLILRLTGGGGRPFASLDDSLLHPSFDYNFTRIVDEETHYRGGVEYMRPCGWERKALRVLGKFTDNVWLGPTDGGRSLGGRGSVAGEWPVSYHGTGRHAAMSIAEEGYRLSKGKRFACGRGIYSSPYPRVAELYADEVRVDGDEYKILFQNRVCPDVVEKIYDKNWENYGADRMEMEDDGLGCEWVVPREDDIRPYGICIKKCN